jgi:hypothetical protein
MLAVPEKTRWGSIVRCIRTVVDAEDAGIKDFFTTDGNVRNSKVGKLVITDPTLFHFFRVVVDDFDPLATLLTLLESDRAILSFCVPSHGSLLQIKNGKGRTG